MCRWARIVIFSHCVNLVNFSISDVMNGLFYCSFCFDKSCAKMISVIKIVHNIFVLSVYITDDNWLLYSLGISKIIVYSCICPVEDIVAS